MAWKMNARPQTVQITKGLCQRFSEMESLPRDRDLKERRLTIYRKLLDEGRFRTVTWAACYCKETDCEYRVNGLHTSTLFGSLGELPELYVTIETYEAETLEDVANLWSTFDSQVASRTAHELYQASAACVPELRELSRTTINKCVPGIAYGLWQDGYMRHSAPERAELLFDHTEFILWLDQEIQITQQDAEHLCRAAVIGVMLGTWQKSRKQATVFWTAVRDEIGAKPGLPDRVIAKWLRRMRCTGHGGPGSGRTHASKLAPPREFYVKSIHAWNAWRRGETTDLKYHASAKIPAMV
jgi:hypothetical protein